MPRQTLGEFTIDRITEVELPAFPADEFFPAATANMVSAAREALPGRIDAEGRIVMSFHAFVLRTGRHTILLDSCCGKPRPGREHLESYKQDFLAGLAAAGVRPEEITHVMCTHLHWDHVGWNTRRENGDWAPTFPNAQYVMAKREYDYWNALYASGAAPDNIHVQAFEDSVLPIHRAERALLVKDDFELDHGIALEPCHGHTPGNVVINLASGGERGVVIGDALHHPIQLLFPDLSSRADTDQDASRVSRKALIEKHADTPTRVLPHHFSTPSCGAIKRAGDAFDFEFIAGT